MNRRRPDVPALVSVALLALIAIVMTWLGVFQYQREQYLSGGITMIAVLVPVLAMLYRARTSADPKYGTSGQGRRQRLAIYAVTGLVAVGFVALFIAS